MLVSQLLPLGGCRLDDPNTCRFWFEKLLDQYFLWISSNSGVGTTLDEPFLESIAITAMHRFLAALPEKLPGKEDVRGSLTIDSMGPQVIALV